MTHLTDEQVSALAQRAQAHLGAGRYREAEQDLLALTRTRRDPEALRRLALVQSQLGKTHESTASVRAMLKLAPRDASAHQTAGLVWLRAGEYTEAINAYTRATEHAPSEPGAWCALATALERAHKLDKAELGIDRALKLNPLHTHAAAIKGSLLRRRGEAENGAELLARIAKHGVVDAHRPRLLAELGEAFHADGQHDDAFAAWSNANRAAFDHHPQFRSCDPDAPLRFIERCRAIPPESFERWASEPAPNDGVRTYFLVGMPRSGTTMTEQILGAHPLVTSTGELPLLSRVMDRLREMIDASALADALDELSPAQIGELRAVYAEHARRLLPKSAPADAIVLDKNPLQIMSAPLLARVFPDARVIVNIRDPRDVCLSCFRQQFSPNNASANFLELDRTARFYDAVMGMYLDQRDRYPFAVREQKYEDLTRDFETQSRGLVEFLGLEWHDRVLRFHEHTLDRPVNTPSYESVTRPIHTGAAGRWKRYKQHLAPHLAVLDPYVDAFGYDASEGDTHASG